MPKHDPRHPHTFDSDRWSQDDVTELWLRWIAINPLKVWRTKGQHSQSTIANLTGTSPSAIQKWEQGHGRPPHTFFEALENSAPRQCRACKWWERKWDLWLSQRPSIRKIA
jgi:transcriptional regulator with XRE-family HTH domain